MNAKEFDSLIKKDKYQIFIFTSLCSIPLSFARHPWFIVNKKGAISRWEVLFRKHLSGTNWGHLHKDSAPSLRGIEIIPYLGMFYWSETLLATIEGAENSTAEKMIELIENSPKNYPYCNDYSLVGANSDTYAQWILDHFPELNIKLPWNCFGKNFKRRIT